MPGSIDATKRSRLSQGYPRPQLLASITMDKPGNACARREMPAIPFSFVGAPAIKDTLDVRRHTPPDQPERIALDVAVGNDAGVFVGMIILDLDAALDLALQRVGYAMEIRCAEEEAP